VIYPWHPWAGCSVRVHELIEKSGGPVLRCSRRGFEDRWLELPVWMFDRTVCRSMSIALRLDVSALSALQALLAARLSVALDGR
jgi:hypothetical protein